MKQESVPNFKDIKKPFYLAYVLSEESSLLLKMKIPPIFSRLFYHHMTIAFKPDESTYEKYQNFIDKTLSLDVVGVCSDELCQTALVFSDMTENEFAHITLSCTPKTKPVYSNSLLRNSKSFEKIERISISGVVKIVYM